MLRRNSTLQNRQCIAWSIIFLAQAFFTEMSTGGFFG
jgi:hypothetical protein